MNVNCSVLKLTLTVNMRLALIIGLAGSSLFLTSCHKCVTCTYTDLEKGDITQEVCGNSKETSSFRENVEDSARTHRSQFQCEENY